MLNRPSGNLAAAGTRMKCAGSGNLEGTLSSRDAGPQRKCSQRTKSNFRAICAKSAIAVQPMFAFMQIRQLGSEIKKSHP